MTPWITEPGVYPDVSDADYHRDPVVGGSLSSTGARTLTNRTPAHFAYQREHGRPDTAAFDLGRVAHAQVLGVGGELVEVDADDWRTKSAREQRDEARAAGHTPLLAKDADRVRVMVTKVRAHPDAGPLFARDGVAELTVVARDPESGVMCRVRFDWFVSVEPGARLIGVDLKTTTNGDPRGPFARSIADYGYVQQDPFYVDCLHWLGMTDGPDGVAVEPLMVFVTVEKDPPHEVAVHRITAEDRDRGRTLNRYARDQFRACAAAGEWPGYEHGVVHEASLPGWWRAQHDAAVDAGRYETDADRAERIGEDDPADDVAAEPAPAPEPDVAAPGPAPARRGRPPRPRPAVAVDQVWRHRREGVRQLHITHVDADRVYVRRSTSRRTQAVSLATLHKDYVLEASP